MRYKQNLTLFLATHARICQVAVRTGATTKLFEKRSSSGLAFSFADSNDAWQMGSPCSPESCFRVGKPF